MTCVHEAELPQSSTETKVLVIVLACGHDPLTVTSLKVIVGTASQLSAEVGLPVLAGAVLAVH
jgi:hypothetical protein